MGSEKYAHKLHWLEQGRRARQDELQQHERVVVVGDFNIAPDDRDVYDPDAWHEKILCSTPERARPAEIMDLGLTDTFRLFEQDERQLQLVGLSSRRFQKKHGAAH